MSPCPTPDRPPIAPPGTAIFLARAFGLDSYLCHCGAHHLGPDIAWQALQKPHCQWCGSPTPAEHYLFCSRHHQRQWRKNRKRRREANFQAEPCPNPYKQAFEFRGSAILCASMVTTQDHPVVWYMCEDREKSSANYGCGMYHLTSDAERVHAILNDPRAVPTIWRPPDAD
jgi:hypothetical protein